MTFLLCTLHHFLTILFVYIISTYGQESSLTFSPDALACIGETVTLTCYAYPPTGEEFTDFAQFSFNGSISEVTINNINSDFASFGYSATGNIPVMGNSARIQLSIDSYQISDSNTSFACYAELTPSGMAIFVISTDDTPSFAASPLTPNIVVSLSSLSTTDCTNTLISWTAPDSDRAIERYYVYRNSTLLAVSTDTQYTDTDQLMVNTPYSYSVIANSCAGNSSGGETIAIKGYSMAINSLLTLSYNNTDSILTVGWTLDASTVSLPLTYSLHLIYSHSQSDTTHYFSNTESLSLLSTVTTLSLLLQQHSLSPYMSVVTNVTVCIQIVAQCFQSHSDSLVCGFYSTEYTPLLSTITTTLPTLSTLTTGTTLTGTTHTEPSLQFLSSLIILIIIILLVSVLLMTIISILVVVIVYLLRKIKHLQSLLKEPPHPYEYIDLNIASPESAGTLSPPKDSTYYSPMQSVGTQPSSATPNYANLK